VAALGRSEPLRCGGLYSSTHALNLTKIIGRESTSACQTGSFEDALEATVFLCTHHGGETSNPVSKRSVTASSP